MSEEKKETKVIVKDRTNGKVIEIELPDGTEFRIRVDENDKSLNINAIFSKIGIMPIASNDITVFAVGK